MRIYCDSSTKEACIVVEGQDPVIIPYPEPVTVNVGEYRVVILALTAMLVSEEVRDLEVEELEVLTDSLLVVNQVNGKWMCKKEHLLSLRDRVWDLLLLANSFPFSKCTLSWIPREENLAGKVLE